MNRPGTWSGYVAQAQARAKRTGIIVDFDFRSLEVAVLPEGDSVPVLVPTTPIAITMLRRGHRVVL